MLSISVAQPGSIEIVERPLPQPAAGEVRIRVRYAGICGSDLHIYHGHNPFAVYPRVVGHEFVGHIDAVGDGVDPARIGQYVTVDPVISCGQCDACLHQRPNVCGQLQVLGVHRDGGFSQFATAPASNAWVLPQGVDERHATTVEPYAVAANVLNRTSATAEDIVLVYGAGPAGITIVDALRNVVGATVAVVDRIDARLAQARRCGANVLINTNERALSETLASLGMTPTLVIDAVCHPAILEEAVRIVAPGGRIGLLGFSSQPTALVQQEVTKRELSLFASRLNARMFPRVIEWMHAGKLHPDILISHAFDFRDIHKAFELIEQHPEETTKVLLDFSA
ncbi:MAG: Zn-dependent oxidoreductase [Rhodocyclaceae bacterium]